MSIRSIIEINHDKLHELRQSPTLLLIMLDRLQEAHEEGKSLVPGITFLKQHHHSESVEIKVKLDY